MAIPPDEERRSSTESCGMERLWRSSSASFMHWYWCTATPYRKIGHMVRRDGFHKRQGNVELCYTGKVVRSC